MRRDVDMEEGRDHGADWHAFAPPDAITVPVRIDAEEFHRALMRLNRLGEDFSRTMARGFARAIAGGRKFSDVLRGLAAQLSAMVLERAAGSLFSGLDAALSGIVKGLTPAARGRVISAGAVRAFARGGVVDAPTLFPMTRGLGLMGEAGPEAILPLARGADGRLGVRAASGGPAQVHVTMHVTTPDAESFRRNRGRVAAELARAVAEGQRQL